MIDSSSHDEETSALIRRFTDSFMERFDVSSREVLWYASFGDLNANECIGCIEPPTRSQPVHEVVSPHRKFKIGEDPVCFERCQIEYMDTSNDLLLKKIHQGRVPRAWRSSLISIWPRTANLSLKFDMQKLLPHKSSDVKLSVRITYLMDDNDVHGGDWEELGRRAMGTWCGVRARSARMSIFSLYHVSIITLEHTHTHTQTQARNSKRTVLSYMIISSLNV